MKYYIYKTKSCNTLGHCAVGAYKVYQQVTTYNSINAAYLAAYSFFTSIYEIHKCSCEVVVMEYLQE